MRFDLSEAKSLKQAGFNEVDIDRARPELSQRCAEALETWNRCGGWMPERLPMIEAAFGIAQIDGLLDRLIVIRTVIDEIRAET